MKDTIIDREYLRSHTNEIFVFGDNLVRVGRGGAAILRDETNTYGFITKKRPDHMDDSYYKPLEYRPIFYSELDKLIETIKDNPSYTYLISRLGGGLANKYRIFEEVIQDGLQVLKTFPNIRFLFE